MELNNSYIKEKRTVSILWANVFAFLMLIPTIMIFGLPFYFIWNDQVQYKTTEFDRIIFIVLFIAGIIIHELLHGIVWAKYAKNGFKSIKFGVIWKKLTPYCHCKEPLKVKEYLLGAAMPGIVLGVLPMVIANFIGNSFLLGYGMIFTLAAGGDILIINLLRKEKKDNYVSDHPTEAGCYVYRKAVNSEK